MLIGCYFKLNFLFNNFENNLLHEASETNEINNIAFSFCTDFYNIYYLAKCGDLEQADYVCANNSNSDCNMILFEATQTSESIFNLSESCNLINIFKIEHNSTFSIYVNFGMICILFKTQKSEPVNYLKLKLNDLNKVEPFKIYIYIHEYQTIPEYLNHYVYILNTRKRGKIKVSFSKKIIYRHVNTEACVEYGIIYKSKDHCVQKCMRHFFNYNYYKFLYLQEDMISMFSSTRNEFHPYCLKMCPIRCNTQYFDAEQIELLNKTFDLESNSLDLTLNRGNEKDVIHNLFINFGILMLNIFTIVGFMIGFNFFIFHNLLELYLKSQTDQVRTCEIKARFSIGLSKLLLCLVKLVLFIGFSFHFYNVFKECEGSKTYEVLITRKNLFAENLTITFCFHLNKLIKDEPEIDDEKIDLKKYFLNSNLSNSIDKVIKEIQIYGRNYFKDSLSSYLEQNSGLFYFEEFVTKIKLKCWKLNLNFSRLTEIHMNTNIIKYTTLDNNVRFIFDLKVHSVYLSEYNLYPNFKRSFQAKRFFKKIAVRFNEAFYNKLCIDYQNNGKGCSSQFECKIDCRIRTIIERYNIYPNQYALLNVYSNHYNISEQTKFIYANATILSKKLKKYCEHLYPLPDCRNVTYEMRQRNDLHNDHQPNEMEYILQLSFNEKIKEINYSFSNFQYLNYLISLLFIYFGTSLSGLISHLKNTKFKKLNLMKLILIFFIIFFEFEHLFELYDERKLLSGIEFDTTDSMNIPKTTICYKVNEILKDQFQNETEFKFQNSTKQQMDYLHYLDGMSKKKIDSSTQNLTELFHEITFLANDFGTYTTLVNQTLNLLEQVGRYNTLFLTTYLYLDFKCYGFELKFKNLNKDIFDLDYVIKFVPKTSKIILHIYKQNFLTSKDYVEFNNQSALIKFTPYLMIDHSFEPNCESKYYERRTKNIQEIRRKFFEACKCVTTFLSILKEYEDKEICNEQFEKVEDEIVKSFNGREETCNCCTYHTYKVSNLSDNQRFTIALSHSGYKFLKVYRLKLGLIELITNLISLPCFLLGINLFKILKILWIRFLD